MKGLSENGRTRCITVLLCIASIMIIVPVLYYCMLSIPYADDFSDARGSIEYYQKYGNHLVAALNWTKHFWKTFQGSYTGMFLVSFFNAYARGGLIGLRIYNTVSIFALFASLFFLVFVFCRNGRKQIPLALTVYLVLIYWITNNYLYSEVYTWNNVICIYIVPLVFVFLGEAFYIEYVRNNGKWWIPSLLCGVVAGGGVINIATLGCGLYLITAVYGLSKSGLRNRIKICTPLAITVACTLINTCAPGNFVRWDGDQGVNVIKVFVVSILFIVKRLGSLCTTTPFVPLVIVLIIVSHKYGLFDDVGKLTYKRPVLVGIMYILGCGIVNFPYCLGNNIDSYGINFEDRGLFVQDISIYLLAVLWIFYFAGYLRVKYREFEFQKSHAKISSVLCVSSLIIVWGCNGFGNTGTPYMIRTIGDGSAKDYADYQEDIIDQVRYGDNIDTIYYDLSKHEKKDPIIKGLRLSDDPQGWDMWHNMTLANYYGKTPPIVVYSE